MNQKVIVPAVALILALLCGLGLWLILRDTDPRPAVAANDLPDPDGPTPRSAGEINARDYNPATVTPDPVTVERAQPYKPPQTMFRLEVSGRVLDAGNLPVADARVRFLGEGALADIQGSGYADESGRYLIVAWNPRGNTPGPGARTGRIVAFGTDQRQGITPSTELGDQPTATMPDVVLDAVSEIRGRIQDESAMPATGVVVHVRSLSTHETIPEGLRVPRVQRTFLSSAVTTDGRGEFRIRGLRPGRYHLDVERSYFGLSQGPLEVEVMQSGAVWVEPVLKSAQFIRGKLLDSDGQPVAGAVVRARSTGEAPPPQPGENQPLKLENAGEDAFRNAGDRNRREASNLRGGPGNMAVTDDQGRFGFFSLVDTTWQISTLVGDSKATLEDVRINQADVVLTVQAESTVSGVVRDAETGLALESFDLRIVQGGDDRVSPFERVAEDRPLPYRPGGLWRVVNPKSADTIRVSAAGYMTALMRIPELAAGERRGNLEVRLLPQCRLSLTLVHQGRRIDVEPVLVLFENSLAYEASSDQTGRVRLPAVAPTTYTVRVSLRDGTRLSSVFQVPAKSSAALELELTASAEK